MPSGRARVIVALFAALALTACEFLFSPTVTGEINGDAGVKVDAVVPGDSGLQIDADASAQDGGTCPPWALPGVCPTQYMNDPLNCCVQGRDCQGGMCTNGKCSPVIIVPDATTDARGIARWGNQLVWATGCGNRLETVSIDGGPVAVLPAGNNCTPTVATRGGNAFWIEWNGPNLNSTPIDGSGPATIVAFTPLAGARANFSRLAVDGQRAYWANDTPGSVWYASLTAHDASASPIATPADSGLTMESAVEPYGIAVDATYVYWSDPGAGVLKRRALATLGQDQLAETVAQDSQGPGDLAVDETNVYWVDNAGAVETKSKDGTGPLSILAPNQNGLASIAVDDRYVYWVEFVGGGNVSRIKKDGSGVVEVIAANQQEPWAITQDCTTVYFTNHNNFGTGQVVKVTK